MFITVCTVGEMETEGEGNGKKVSKRRAAEKMLEEMRTRWPPATLRPRHALEKRRHPPTKKKPRNLIKVCINKRYQPSGCGFCSHRSASNRDGDRVGVSPSVFIL